MTQVVSLPLPSRVRRLVDVSPRRAFGVIGVLSLVVVAGLAALVAVVGEGEGSDLLPVLNGSFNAGAAIGLVVGWRAIRRGDQVRHRAAMTTALGFSALFLLTYVTRHALYGDSAVDLGGWWRATYLTVLTVHVVLSIVGLPAVLATVWATATGRIELHKRLARPTLPVWLVVSLTGVLVMGWIVFA